MKMKLKNIFDQFIPKKLLSIPISLIGTIIALSWLLLINKRHFLPKRKTLINLFIRKSLKNLLPHKTKKSPWTPWIFSIFILCLSYKLLRLIPYTFSQTSHLRITFRLSWPIWLSFQILGIIKKWKSKIRHLVPQGTPIPLIPIMILIETLRLLIQPLTLGFRLGAKLLAGHLLIFLCSCVVWKVTRKSTLGFLSFALLFLLFLLEIAVAWIQAGVFIILRKNYLEEKLN